MESTDGYYGYHTSHQKCRTCKGNGRLYEVTTELKLRDHTNSLYLPIEDNVSNDDLTVNTRNVTTVSLQIDYSDYAFNKFSGITHESREKGYRLKCEHELTMQSLQRED